MIGTTSAVSASQGTDAAKSAARTDRASEDEKKSRRQRFLSGLQESNADPRSPSTETRPNAARTAVAKGQTAVGEDASPSQRVVKNAEVNEAEGGPDDRSAVDDAAARAKEEAPEEGLLDVLVRRGAAKNARRILRQRVSDQALTLANTDPVAARSAEPGDLEAGKKSVVEASQRDPEVAIQAGIIGTETPAAGSSPQSSQSAPLRPNHPVTPATYRQMVAFAEVHHDRSGVIEFKLGLRGAVLAGAKIVIRSFGQRKIGLRVANATKNAISEQDVKELVAALRRRDLDVIEVEIV